MQWRGKEKALWKRRILSFIVFNQFYRKCKVRKKCTATQWEAPWLSENKIAFCDGCERLLPSAEKNVSMCICILVHVCLLRGKVPACKAIHALLPCYMLVITRGGCKWKGHNCSGCLFASLQHLVSVRRELLLYSSRILFINVRASAF